MRYIDDFVVCFQYREDARRVQEALRERLGRFSLSLEPSKTRLVEFGRFAQRHAPKRGRKRPETLYFLGFTFLLHAQSKGKFQGGTVYREDSATAQPVQPSRVDAAYMALAGKGAGSTSQPGVAGPLWLLRHCRELPGLAESALVRGAVLVQNVLQRSVGTGGG